MANTKTEYCLVSYNNFDLFLKEALESTSHTLKNDCRRFLSTLTKDQVSIWKSGQNQDKHLLVEVLTNRKTDIKLLPVSITDPYLYCETWVFSEPIAIYVPPIIPKVE
jgi:hypothetical protein